MIWMACRRCRVPASPLSAVHKESRHKMKAIKKHTRAEIEGLIKSLLAWQNEQPECRKDIYKDRILKPAELKPVKNMFNKASSILSQVVVFVKSLSCVEKLRFRPFNKPDWAGLPDFVITPDITASNALDAVERLIDALCELRNTLPKEKAVASPGKESDNPEQWLREAAAIQTENSKSMPLKIIMTAFGIKAGQYKNFRVHVKHFGYKLHKINRELWQIELNNLPKEAREKLKKME